MAPFRSVRVSRPNLLTALIYLTVVIVAFSLGALLSRRHRKSVDETPLSASPPAAEAQPSFSLSTNRTYGTSERARVWISYQGINHLDFRVYRVNDPAKYAMRVQVPGEFRIAPARAELMYQPTVQANTASTRMRIDDRR